MSTVLPSLGAGVVFGLALAAPPGPMNAVIAEESVVRGWSAGTRAGLGAMSADALFFVLAALGLVAFVNQFPTLQALMVGVGGVLMLYFAYGAAQEMDTTFREAADPHADSAGFSKAFVLALTNPYQILFWLTIGVGLLETGTVDVLSHMPYLGESLSNLLIVQTGSPALIIGFFTGITIWATGFPAALVAAEKRVDSFAPTVAAVSALVLGGFGVGFIWDAVQSLVL
ncbi:LysE family translocator [Haloferax mediterranei ATCC 33500]|uniref:LysE family L-lysine efflux protein n=1 Tax=Haloferax mediterranei (strain ATCC 33500 / DSM 1411 / JCM 8866 / NBRC 14739 / NCIMB 2177 / R-4) TaxID=523841 RepID=I3R2Q3_HALMT|nr:LysE family transporter [Haloferax mediterranei]AFK18513.2 LysE family L-lysine efflux protein [Haloferax mediterranei ATCC 33500]AHZ22107.1 lysine transporter LysE [Haloferax mediterranei ATCC 33500]EMA02214.1 LysE family L-lysine efflux protein [Haloferax mediterranei ATCC 33500]MDX5988601.1 LysE family transporter [Haloferax mediterranei ATCC 33500]QCQ75017.1 LysE family translocator [Haloferax mediterranei ATCC 33500]